jgi:hypothetical protein
MTAEFFRTLLKDRDRCRFAGTTLAEQGADRETSRVTIVTPQDFLRSVICEQ